MNSLKIALFTYSTKPRGGVVHTLNLAEELASLGHHVHIYSLGAGDQTSVVEKSKFFRPVSVPYTIIPVPVYRFESMEEKIRTYIDFYTDYLGSIEEAYDIYHSEDCISANALLNLRSLGLIEFYLRTVHHLDDFKSESLIECQRKSVFEPDYLVVVSKYWERVICSRFFLDSALIKNGVDLERFSFKQAGESKEEAKKNFSVDECKVMLSIGGIEPRKNTLTTLRAFKIAKDYFERKGETLVWLIGGGETLFDYRDYREKFFAEISTMGLGLDEDIMVLGKIPCSSLPMLYRAAEVFVFPSLKEGWGLVVLEAMASGVPVVASDIEPLTEYLRDGHNAVLVPPMEHETLARRIVKISVDVQFRDMIVENGRKTAEEYSWRSTALKHVDLYGRVLREVKSSDKVNSASSV